MTTYNHAYDIGFEIAHSTDPKGRDISPCQLRAAIRRRLADLSDDELLEAVGLPFDTYEEEEAA